MLPTKLDSALNVKPREMSVAVKYFRECRLRCFAADLAIVAVLSVAEERAAVCKSFKA
jgi:hypothetical protein